MPAETIQKADRSVYVWSPLAGDCSVTCGGGETQRCGHRPIEAGRVRGAWLSTGNGVTEPAAASLLA